MEPIHKEGVIRGVRMWRVSFKAGSERPRLASIAQTSAWPRGAIEARHEEWQYRPDGRYASARIDDPSPARCPHAGHLCGLNAFWDLDALQDQYSLSTVAGTIEAWGKVRPGVEGFRSEFAMPTGIIPPTCSGYECSEPATTLWVEPKWTGGYPVKPLRPGFVEAREFAPWTSRNYASRPLCDAHAGAWEPVEAEGANPRHCLWEGMWAGRTKKCARKRGLLRQELEWGGNVRCAEHTTVGAPVDETMQRLADWYEVDLLPFEPMGG